MRLRQGSIINSKGEAVFGIKMMGLDMNEGGFAELNVRCVDVSTFLVPKTPAIANDDK